MFLIRIKEFVPSSSGFVAPDRMDAPWWSFPESDVVFWCVHRTIVASSRLVVLVIQHTPVKSWSDAQKVMLESNLEKRDFVPLPS